MMRRLSLLCLVPLLHGCTDAADAASQPSPAMLLPALQNFAQSLPARFDAIPAERKELLDELASFIRDRRSASEPAQVTFICTHNSRRSHMGQLAATLAAAHYGLDGVEAFSGGTETTAFHPNAVAAMRRAGFEIEGPLGENPRYSVRYAENRDPVVAFSKTYEDPANPQQGFAAVMSCGQADEACPIVDGAALRLPLHFDDPKISDGTPDESATYDRRARQIAAEVFYAFSRVQS